MRDPHDIRHGDTWEVRNGRAVVVASHDWPPPAKGTHESDLEAHGNYIGRTDRRAQHFGREFAEGYLEFQTAREWSRSPEPQASDSTLNRHLPIGNPPGGTTTPHDQETGTQA